MKWREKKDELGSLVEEFKEKKNLEIEREYAAKWREEKTELEKDANKLREEKAELTTTKVELQLALRQVRSPNVYNFCDDRYPVGSFLPHSFLISFQLLKAN